MARRGARAPAKNDVAAIRKEAARIRRLVKMGAPVVKNRNTYKALDYIDRQKKAKLRPILVSARKKKSRREFRTRKRYYTGAILFPVDNSDYAGLGTSALTPSAAASISLARAYAMREVRSGHRVTIMYTYLAKYDFEAAQEVLRLRGRALYETMKREDQLPEVPSDNFLDAKTRAREEWNDPISVAVDFDSIRDRARRGFVIVDISVQRQTYASESAT